MARDLIDLLAREAGYAPSQFTAPSTMARFAELVAQHVAHKRMHWHPVATKPDAEINVLCWRHGDEVCEWFAGWWDDEAGAWYDCATGRQVEDVTHWADVEGPT